MTSLQLCNRYRLYDVTGLKNNSKNLANQQAKRLCGGSSRHIVSLRPLYTPEKAEKLGKRLIRLAVLLF